MSTKHPTTPLQIARLGHIAQALRAFMAARDWAPADFNQALGRERHDVSIYNYLNCRSAPNAEARAKIRRLTGIAEAELTARDPHTATASISREALAAPQRALIVRAKPPRQRLFVQQPVAQLDGQPVLQFTANADGSARLAFDVTMQGEKAVRLLRILLDAGVIITKG